MTAVTNATATARATATLKATTVALGIRPRSDGKKWSGAVCAGCFFGCALNEEAHRLITRHRQVRSWDKGEFVFHAGEEAHGIWSVCKGRIKVFKETEGGKQLTIRIAVPGDLVGHRSLLAGQNLSGYGVVLESAVTAYLPAAVVMKLIEIDPNVRTQIIHKLAGDLGHAETLATNMAYSRAEQRLLAAIAELCHNTGECGDEYPDRPFELAAPRQELAELSGLTVEATVRTLRRLEEAGVLECHGRRISVLEPDALKDACAG